MFRLRCWECQEVGRIGRLVVQTSVAKAFIERHLETCTKIGHPPDFRIKCERCKNPDEIGHDQIHTEAAKSYIELHLLGSVVIFTVIPAKAGIQRPLAANAYLPATGF